MQQETGTQVQVILNWSMEGYNMCRVPFGINDPDQDEIELLDIPIRWGFDASHDTNCCCCREQIGHFIQVDKDTYDQVGNCCFCKDCLIRSGMPAGRFEKLSTIDGDRINI